MVDAGAGGPSAQERGLTLLETAIALALGGLLLAASVASVRGFVAHQTLAGWRDSIVNDIRSAQQLAIARRQRAAVTFTAGTPATYGITIGDVAVRSQTLSPDLVLAPGTVQFNALGAPIAGATLTLSDAQSDQTVVISVAPITGTVTVQ